MRAGGDHAHVKGDADLNLACLINIAPHPPPFQSLQWCENTDACLQVHK